MARAASVTARTSCPRAGGASSRSTSPTTPIAPATTPSRPKMGAARLPHVAEWIADADSSICAALAGQALQAVDRGQAQARVKAP